MKKVLTMVILSFISAAAQAESLLTCKVQGQRGSVVQTVTFDLSEFADSMLVAKSVEIEDGKSVELTVGYLAAEGTRPATGFLGINIQGPQMEPLAFSRHSLDMQSPEVFFRVHQLASVICASQR